MDEMFDRYALFASADFFVGYWPVLAGSQHSDAAVSVIQSAARATMADFMAGESTYWHVDFSLERQARSFAIFSASVRILSTADRVREEILRRNFCEDKREQANVVFALDFLYRVAHDREFCVGVGVSAEDAEVVAASFSSSRVDSLDTYQLERDWLASTSTWDETVRNVTPDLPAYTVTNFADAYRKTVALPTFVANLSTAVMPQTRKDILTRLTASLENQFPPRSSLTVPLVLRAPE